MTVFLTNFHKNTGITIKSPDGSRPALGTNLMLGPLIKSDGGKSMRTSAKARLLVLALAWVGFGHLCHAQAFEDYFTNRETLTSAAGVLTGDNATATVEPGEPLHGGKPGGHSLWISWVAPSNGVVRFKSETSSFDTLMSAYHFSSTNDTTLDKLIETARNDDSEELGDRESELDFGVQAGQRYEIAIDGYYGAAGGIKLQWSMDVTLDPPPTILSTSPDATLKIGDAITLVVALTNVQNNTKFQWFFNGVELADAKNTNLVISSMQVTNVGRYKLLIDVGSHITFFTRSTELQINTEGASALAQSKFPDAPGTELVGHDGTLIRQANAGLTIIGPRTPQAGNFGVVLGYSGSQIFNTTFATTDPAEPMHCSVTGGSSYWLAYQPPANGTITLDTVGSTYDTVMEVYTYNAPPTGYQDLISIECDHDSIAGGSRVQIPVTKTRQYLVAVAGVNGARGTAYLNYTLNTNQLPQRPVLTSSPGLAVVTNGANVTLAPSVTGSPPLHFAWSMNAAPLTNSYAPGLGLSNVTTDQTGNYFVTITNDFGATNALLPLHVVVPASCNIVQTTPDSLQISIPTQTGLHYTVEEAPGVFGAWQSTGDTFIGDGKALVINLPVAETGFYRIRIE
jgi:hypothetical protein